MNGSVPQFFFVYDEAGHLSGKYDGGGKPLWETAWLGDLPVAVLQPGARFFVAPDHLGAPHQITDSTGAVVWQWNPDPFGNGDPIGSLAYELRFPGQYFDQATKLHYNMARDYDPRTGRYIESDPIGLAGGINTYAYVDGNPLSKTDPYGTGSGPPDCANAIADLAAAAANVAGRVADIIANEGKPDPGQHRKALREADRRLKDALRKVLKNCACVAGAAAAIAAAEAAIEEAAPYLLLAPLL